MLNPRILPRIKRVMFESKPSMNVMKFREIEIIIRRGRAIFIFFNKRIEIMIPKSMNKYIPLHCPAFKKLNKMS